MPCDDDDDNAAAAAADYDDSDDGGARWWCIQGAKAEVRGSAGQEFARVCM
jgi:hypothetical protein